MKAYIALAAVLAATAASAGAQTGLRADVHLGWDRLSAHQRTDVGINGGTTRERENGLIYGGEIGYDLALSGFKLGVYAGIEGGTAKRCSEVFAEVETCEEAGRNFTAGARAGYQVTDKVLVYAKGGYSNGAVKLRLIDHVTPANSLSVSENMDGFHMGAGVQVGLLDNVYAKVEYVRTDYRDYSFKEGTATIKGGVDRDNVVFGVGIAF
ncbi:MAG TPA: outer membrane beta-barrel protein [Sphingobium sp.]